VSSSIRLVGAGSALSIAIRLGSLTNLCHSSKTRSGTEALMNREYCPRHLNHDPVYIAAALTCLPLLNSGMQDSGCP
jgi:hypothetical protein